jgi:hypothetical protein
MTDKNDDPTAALIQRWQSVRQVDEASARKIFETLCRLWGCAPADLPRLIEALEVPNLLDWRGVVMWLHDTLTLLNTENGRKVIRGAAAAAQRIDHAQDAPSN